MSILDIQRDFGMTGTISAPRAAASLITPGIGEYHADVIIVGVAMRHCAVICAAESGASVLLLERARARVTSRNT